MTRRMRRVRNGRHGRMRPAHASGTGGLDWRHARWVHIPRFGIDRNRSNKKNVRTDAIDSPLLCSGETRVTSLLVVCILDSGLQTNKHNRGTWLVLLA